MRYKTQKLEVRDIEEARELIRKIGCDPKSIDIMAPKAIFMVLSIENVHPVDAIIIKQDMLSAGGEVAIPKDVFERKEHCKILIMGTLRHFMDLSEKLKRHHSRLKEIAEILDGEIKKMF